MLLSKHASLELKPRSVVLHVLAQPSLVNVSLLQLFHDSEAVFSQNLVRKTHVLVRSRSVAK